MEGMERCMGRYIESGQEFALCGLNFMWYRKFMANVLEYNSDHAV